MHESESEVSQSCLTLCDPMDCSLPGTSVHGIFQARILEWVAIAFSPGGSDGKKSACNVGDLGWEDHLEEGMTTHSSILVWRIPMERGAWRATVCGVTNE